MARKANSPAVTLALLPALAEAGFRIHEPHGAYYVMTDIRNLTSDDDVTFADPGYSISFRVTNEGTRITIVRWK